MVHFANSTSPSGQQLLVILDNENDSIEAGTSLAIYEAISGKYAGPLPKATTTRPMKDWSMDMPFKGTRSPKAWILLSSTHQHPSQLGVLSSLGRRIIQNEARWSSTLEFPGEFRFKEKYWEWAQDIMSRCEKNLLAAKVYEAVYASLFTYDCHPNIMKAFCEAWSPSTNTLLTTTGEVSISLWDLHVLGGLPILGSHYDEVVPHAMELTGVDVNNKRFVPRSCEYLFHAYHLLKKDDNDNSGVSIDKWINFWFKKATRYSAPPPREEKRSRPKFTDNPCGVIPKHEKWTIEGEALFTMLNIRTPNNKDVTFLAAFLSCWLCTFVFPNEEIDLIRPSTFKMASIIASGEQVSLAIPVLTSIYKGLNCISNSNNPSKEKSIFPTHYVYGWLAHYFKTHYDVPQGLQSPPMATYSGEGSAKNFNGEEARKRIHRGESIVWTPTILTKHKSYTFIDDGKSQEAELGYFLSLRSSMLPLRKNEHFFVEPYSPHRFSRQFGFLQDAPGDLKHTDRETTLREGLRLWVLCTLGHTMSKVTFPCTPHQVKKHYSPEYSKWWDQVHGSYLEDNILKLNPPKDEAKKVEKLPCPKRKLVKDNFVIKSSKAPKVDGNSSKDNKCSSSNHNLTKESASNSSKGKELQKDSFSAKDHLRDASAGTPSQRTKSIEAHNDMRVDEPLHSQHSISNSNSPKQDDHEEVSSSKSNKSNPQAKVSSSPNYPAISVFEGKSLILDFKKKYIMGIWNELRQKIVRTPIEQISSLEEQVSYVLEEISKDGIVDISPLNDRLKSFFASAYEFDSMRSTFSEKMAKESYVELLSTTKQRLDAIMEQRSDLHTQVGEDKASLKRVRAEISDLNENIKRLKKEEAKLSTLLEEKNEQLSNVESTYSTIKEELALVEKTPALTEEDEVKLRKMKEHMEANQEDLGNFSLLF